MTIEQSVQSCRWSEQTLFLPPPYWLEAWDFPWCCRLEPSATPRLLSDGSVCRTCPLWVRRDDPQRDSAGSAISSGTP